MPFGLAVGAIVPNELESVLILIGVVGIQLTLQQGNGPARFLPFWGGQKLLDEAGGTAGSAFWPIIAAAAYGAALFCAAVVAVNRRYANVR